MPKSRKQKRTCNARAGCWNPYTYDDGHTGIFIVIIIIKQKNHLTANNNNILVIVDQPSSQMEIEHAQHTVFDIEWSLHGTASSGISFPKV